MLLTAMAHCQHMMSYGKQQKRPKMILWLAIAPWCEYADIVRKTNAAEDAQSAEILEIIMHDVGHVATGKRWFDYQYGMERLDQHRQGLVGKYLWPAKPPSIFARNSVFLLRSISHRKISPARRNMPCAFEPE